MIQLEVGFGPKTYGTVTQDAHGQLVYGGSNIHAVETLVTSMRQPGQSDLDLLHSMPQRLTGRAWAKVVPIVRAVFDGAKDSFLADSSWQNTETSVRKQLKQMQARGVKQVKWVAPADACDVCMANDGHVRDLGKPFE